MTTKQQLQHQLSDHCRRMKELQNSDDPYKWQAIALLDEECRVMKEALNNDVK